MRLLRLLLPSQGSSGDTRFGGGQHMFHLSSFRIQRNRSMVQKYLDVMGRRTMEIVGPEIAKLK